MDNFPMSMYPQTKPLSEGYYLVHNSLLKEWIVAEWRDYFPNNPDGGWQPDYYVDWFIPFKLESNK